MPTQLIIMEAAGIVAGSSDGTVTAAIIGGIFLLLNGVITVVLTRAFTHVDERHRHQEDQAAPPSPGGDQPPGDRRARDRHQGAE